MSYINKGINVKVEHMDHHKGKVWKLNIYEKILRFHPQIELKYNQIYKNNNNCKKKPSEAYMRL